MPSEWVWISIGLAVFNVVMQVVDLHLTSEPLKRGWAHEDNANLAGMLNTTEDHARKFWRLAAIKGVCAIGAVAMMIIAWRLDSAGEAGMARAVILLQALVAVYYARVMVGNWQIYKAGSAGLK